ncbi:hypothetical protein [Mongoliitalea lutea]|uniref:Dolichyl-phosphate-mannose-protein mannosyltransferase n=1 Tax=Mongoliitalea lutea TaxID=849756 RepID=A0A8J3CU06_9BACT|nr:hypothetical protein [Mongoliitalea lutea]GHB23710.1 hypothetical protein GCM10008106_00350 [Mongoliitalea lutea]
MKIGKTFTIVIWTVFLLHLVLVIVAIPRGFDFSDEGLYGLMASPDQENVQRILNYDVFFKLIFQFTSIEFSIIELRFLRLLVTGVSWIAAMQALRILESKVESWQLVMLGISVLLSYTFLPQSLSYNHLTVMSGLCMLPIIIKWYHYKKSSLLDVIVIGLLLALLAYVKVTAALGMGLLMVGLLVRSKQLFNWKNLFLYLPFCLMETISYFFLGESRFYEVFIQLMGGVVLVHYPTSYVVKTLVVGFLWFMWIFLAGKLIGTTSQFIGNPWIRWSFGFLMIGWSAYVTFIVPEPSILFVVIFISILGMLSTSAISSSSSVGLTLLLVGIPWLLHAGSNVYFFRMAIHYLPFWMLFLLSLENTRPRVFKRFFWFFPFASLGLMVYALWLHPFRQPSLLLQNRIYTMGNGQEILMDKARMEFLHDIRAYMEQYDVGTDELFSFYQNPGVLYVLGLVHPKVPGVWNAAQLEMLAMDWKDYKLLIFSPEGGSTFPWDAYFEQKYIYEFEGERFEIWIRTNE